MEKLQVSTLSKLIVDQLLFSPLFTVLIVAYKIILMSSMKISMNELLDKLVVIVPSACKASWMFWIPQRYFTLTFIPTHFHVIFGSLCSFFWQILFTIVTTSSDVKEL